MMTLDDFYFLLSDEGRAALTETAVVPITPQNHLSLATQLRKRFNSGQAHAILETVLLRQQAVTKFSHATQMFFTRPALEQATAEVVARYRAQRFHELGLARIADLGCSVGGDAIAMAAQAEVTGVEWNPVRLAMAQENSRVYGYGGRFHPLQADLMELTPLPVDGVFFDPARRDEQGKRIYSVHHYKPPLSLINKWRTWIENTAVKISPGVDYDELPEDAEVEFISLNGEVKEAVLWFGDLRRGGQQSSAVARRATLLPHAYTLTTDDLPDTPIAITPPQRYLYEPDKAIIRAHLVQAVAQQLGASQLDASIAYLTSDTYHETPFARAFVVEDWFPFQLKRLRHYLREHNVGQVTIKKRGSPLEPDTLRQQLRLNGTEKRILFLTQSAGDPIVIIGSTP